MTTSEPVTFAGVPARSLEALGTPAAVIFGADEGSPYRSDEPSHSAGSADAIRRASGGLPMRRQFDFDVGGVVLRADDERVVDAGTVPTRPDDAAGNRARIEAATRAVLAAGAVPVLLGGDDSVPIPWLRAFAGRGPLTVVQVDAHVDWGDVIQDNPLGYGSTMRRAAEIEGVTAMVQVGLRGLGSGTPDQLDDACAWGSRLVTMRDLRRDGVAAALRHVEPGSECLLAIDCDGLDPSIMPAVAMPGPGGLLYGDMLDLIDGIAERGRIAGLALVEHVPARDDPHGLSALTAARIVASVLGRILAATDAQAAEPFSASVR